MTASAPRYDPRIIGAVRKLDDEREPIAETCRRVGAFTDQLGLPRPSYVHLRRIVKAERERRRALEGVTDDILRDALGGRAPQLGVAFERAREANARAKLGRGS